MEKEGKNMSRRKFLQVSGSLVIGAAFAGVIGNRLWKMFSNPGELFYDAKTAKRNKAMEEMANYVSPFRRTFGFIVPDDITALEVLDRQIVVATPNNIHLYGLDGNLEENFAIRSDLRDMAVFAGKIYLLFASRVEVCDPQGNLLQEWNACSDDADYCSLTVFDEGVYVTDASAKNICQYHLDGSLARFIDSPKGFVVPSYSFGITHLNGSIFCSNPGRHQVEQYTAKGEFVASFGKSGIGPGEFSGCCNPVRITTTATGELLTSEKGIPRICCYVSDGTFRSILLDEKALGGGHAAYDMQMMDNKLIVTGANKVSVYEYDNRRSAQTLCGSCTVDCPMKIIS